MKIRVLVLLLIVALCVSFGLVACGETDDDNGELSYFESNAETVKAELEALRKDKGFFISIPLRRRSTCCRHSIILYMIFRPYTVFRFVWR